MNPATPRQLSLFDQWRERVRRSAWRAVKDHDCLPELAAAVAELNRWTCRAASAAAQVSKWLSPDARRPLPAYLLPIITALTGEDLGVVQTQLEAAQEHREQQERAELAQRDRKQPIRVEPRRPVDRRRA